MPSPEANIPSNDELIDRVAYLVERSNGVAKSEARERARQILRELSPSPSPAKLAKALRGARSPKSNPIDSATENWFLSGIARLSTRDAEVLDVLLSAHSQGSKRLA